MYKPESFFCPIGHVIPYEHKDNAVEIPNTIEENKEVKKLSFLEYIIDKLLFTCKPSSTKQTNKRYELDCPGCERSYKLEDFYWTKRINILDDFE